MARLDFVEAGRKKTKNKIGIENEQRRGPQTTQRTRSCRLRRRRRFHTRKPWLFFLAFSTYLKQIASSGPMLAIIQIVNLRFIHASQQQEPTWDLIIDTRRKCRSWLRLNAPYDFFPEAWAKRCNEYSIFKRG